MDCEANILGSGYWIQEKTNLKPLTKFENMPCYKELEIYQLACRLSIKVHETSLKLPQYELYEPGSQIRRSSMSIKDNIAEGYGRKRYKADDIKFLVYAQASCDETTSPLEMIYKLYAEKTNFKELIPYY